MDNKTYRHKGKTYFSDNEYTTDMATIAAKRAIENAGLKPEDIDLIMLATVTPDYFTPACACVVQSNLGAVNAAAFDYNAACSGFVYRSYYRRTVYKSKEHTSISL